MLRYLCFVVLFWSANSASAPFIKPCKDNDDKCILESSQAALPFVAAGIPELGVKSMDPLHIPLITSDQGALNLSFMDTELKGLKGCKIESIKHDRVKGKQILVLRCSMDLTGQYLLNGQLLIFPVQGKGKYNIKIRDIVIKTITDLTTVQGKDGNPHWKVAKWRHSFEVKGGASFSFENLFNGNKALADPVTEFVNTSWKDVMVEIAPPIVKTIVGKVYDGIDQLYEAVSADKLFIS